LDVWDKILVIFSRVALRLNGVFFFIIIINEFHRGASLEQNFRAAVCHVLH